MDYTTIHKNVRVGCYFNDVDRRGYPISRTTFYPLQKLIPLFDSFADVAENEAKSLDGAIVDYIFKDRRGSYHYNQLELIWKLKEVINLEIVPRSIWGNLFGYDFHKATRIQIDPNAIAELSVASSEFFRIQVKSFFIEVWYKAAIRISSHPSYFKFMSEDEQKADHQAGISVYIRS